MRNPGIIYWFGDAEIQPDSNMLIKEGVAHRLSPRLMEVLVYLITHNDRIVSGEELLDTFWAGRVVEESTIHRQISRLRSALGDSAREAKYIKTVSKRGYQAVASVKKRIVAPSAIETEIIVAKEDVSVGADLESRHYFISCAHTDEDIIRKAIKELAPQGAEAPLDIQFSAEADSCPANDVSILGSNAVLFFVSEKSIVSDRCNREIKLAKDEKILIIPIYLEDVELTSDLKMCIPRDQVYGSREQSYQTQLQQKLTPYQKSKPALSSKFEKPTRLSAALFVIFLLLLGFLINKAASTWLFNNTTEPRMTIAVLPLDSLSGSDSMAFFTEGLTQSILADFTDIGYMIVAPQNSVMQLQQQGLGVTELASTLKVDYVLTGSVQEIEGVLRVTTQLIRAADARHVFSKTYLQKANDTYEPQKAISKNISRLFHDKIALDLRRKYPRRFSEFEDVHPAAIFTFLKAMEIGDEYELGEGGDPVVAMHLLQKAVKTDPDFLEAHSQLAWYYLRRVDGELSLRESSKRAHASINRILAMDPNSTSASFFLAQAYIQLDLNYAEAERLIKSEISKAPDAYWWRTFLAEIAVREGRFESAIKLFRADATLHSTVSQPEMLPVYASVLFQFGAFNESLNQSNKALELLHGGPHRTEVLLLKVDTLLKLDRAEEARALLEEAVLTSEGLLTERFVTRFMDTGQFKRAKEALQASVVTPTNRFYIARGYDYLGDLDKVFDLIHDGIKDNDPSIMIVMRSNLFSTAVHEDRRYQEMLALLETRESHTPIFLQNRQMRVTDVR
mgnify:FL=1